MKFGVKGERAVRQRQIRSEAELQRRAEAQLRKQKLLTREGEAIPPASMAPAPRKPPGRGSAVTPEERLDIWRLKAEDGLSDSKIAEMTGRTRETIARVCDENYPEFQRFRDVIGAKRVELAKARFRTKALDVQDKWEAAMDAAVERGNHKPMMDWLREAGVVERDTPDGALSASLVMLHVNVPGMPGLPDPPPIESVAFDFFDALTDVNDDTYQALVGVVTEHGYPQSLVLPLDYPVPPGAKLTQRARDVLAAREQSVMVTR